MSFAVRVHDLWKEYRIGGPPKGNDTFYDALSGFFRSPFGVFRRRAQRALGEGRFWALREVDFELAPGEVLGVIGKNGAGKSTLLKILSRITDPTRGRIEVRGRLASLLEVGTGFHPELTGRENIYLNGAILGMARREINTKFEEIVDFSEVEKFLDTPVKRYSSGMYVRLAFGVAAHLDPDILVVDEVLAVGDASFQAKCLAKMGQVRNEGRTVLFVSHNMAAVQALCRRVLWLESGEVRDAGNPHEIVARYMEASTGLESQRSWKLDEAPGNRQVRILASSAQPLAPSPTGSIDLDTPVRLRFDYENLVEGAALCLSLHVIDQQGQIAFNAFPWREPKWHGRPFSRGRYRSTCVIPARLLNDGTYTVRLFVMRDQSEVILRLDDAISFRVLDVPEPNCGWHRGWPGAVRPFLEWNTEKLEDCAVAGEGESVLADKETP